MGIVADVAADSTEATKGVWSFEVRITPQENKLMSGSDQFALCPSMTTSVDIATDNDVLSVISSRLLLIPFLAH